MTDRLQHGWKCLAHEGMVAGRKHSSLLPYKGTQQAACCRQEVSCGRREVSSRHNSEGSAHCSLPYLV